MSKWRCVVVVSFWRSDYSRELADAKQIEN